MVRCSVLSCKSDSGTKTPELSFHSFPEDHNLRRSWIVATGRTDWIPKPSSKICSRHFDKSMLNKKKALTLLLPNAVPILIKATSGPSQECPDFNPVITEIKSEADLIKQEEDPQSDDTLSLTEYADQPSEDLIPLSNAPDPFGCVKLGELDVEEDVLEVSGPVPWSGELIIKPVELPKAVEETSVPLPPHLRKELLRAGNDCYKLIRIQGNLIDLLSMRCRSHRQKLDNYVQIVQRRERKLVQHRDQKISELQTEVEALWNFIGERGWEASSIGGGKIYMRRIQTESSNAAEVEKRNYTRPKWLVNAHHTSVKQTSSVGTKPTSVCIAGMSDVLQKPSVSIPGTSGVLQNSSVRIPGTSGILQNSSVGIRGTSDVLQKPSVGIPGTSDVLQKPSVGIPGTSDVLQNSSVGIPGTSGILQKSLVGIKRTLDTQENSSIAVHGTSKIPKESHVGLQRTSKINIPKSLAGVKHRVSTSDNPQKSPTGIPDTSGVLQKSSVCLRHISDINLQKSSIGVKYNSDMINNPSITFQPISVIPQTSSVGFQRTTDIGQRSLVIQIDGLHTTVLQPKLVRLNESSIQTG